MKNSTYDILKKIALVVLPALATLVITIFGIWNIPYGEQIAATITAIDTALGVILGVSTYKYNKEISALRNSLYKDEEDDAKAVGMIKEKYKATYFPEPDKTPSVPNEPSFNSTTQPKEEIKITRKTSLRDLLKK